jgi:hypothetical protein
MSPYSRAQLAKTERGSSLASGILPMRNFGGGPGGRFNIGVTLGDHVQRLFTTNDTKDHEPNRDH